MHVLWTHVHQRRMAQPPVPGMPQADVTAFTSIRKINVLGIIPPRCLTGRKDGES